ncbi:MAG TPA: carboxypeptidase-like regulatory domain-containing protein, partial [Saprospiraceae bacterium]|nr:carboxypeptidase-like regulatory domain-containing protein [Saprospiraceae bacterium]
MKQFLFFFGLAALLTATQSSTPTTQAFTLKGIVVDKDSGDPLVGANVLIKGTTQGTVTDFDGKFQLEVLEKCVSLEVSYVGYEPQSIKKACAGKDIRVAMNAAQVLDEVVVIGYEEQKENESA